MPRSAVLGPATLASILVTTAGLTFVRQVLAGALVVSVEEWAVIGPTLLWPVWGVSLGAATLAYYHRTRETQARRP